MPILRQPKRNRYTVISNDPIQSAELSLKAKGMLSVLLSLPDDWEFNQKGLKRFSRDGIDSIRSALDELEEAGYLRRERERYDNGKLRGAEWYVYEKSEKPILENPILDNPILVNPTLQSTKQQSTNLQSNKNTLSGKPDDAEKISEIVAYLNNKIDSNYKATTRSTSSRIKARLREGFSVDDFKAVIDSKASDWLGTSMAKYLRPETLFGTKFEGYLNEKRKAVRNFDKYID